MLETKKITVACCAGGNNLMGQLPGKENGQLITVQVFDLRGNNMTGHIPIEICNMKALHKLELSSNALVGKVPYCLSVLDLEQIYLQGNSLEGSLPTELGDLKNLTEFFISENMLTGNPIDVFNQMESLKVLMASDNQFTGTIDTSFLDNIDTITWVDISDNNFNSSSFPSHLLSRPYLNLLDVSR